MSNPFPNALEQLLIKQVRDNGTQQTSRTNINFIGATITDDPTNDATNVAFSGSGGGSTTTTGNYTQPPVGSTVIITVGDATAAVVGKGVEIAGGGFYTATHVAGLNVTILNGTSAVNASPTTVINSGAVVTFGGLGAPQAGGVTNGQALQLQDAGLTGAGIRTLVNALETGADPLGDITGYNSQPAIMAAIAAAGSQTDVYIPAGYFFLFAPIVNDSGNCISIRGESGHSIINGNTGGQSFRTTLSTFFIGDAIVVCPLPNGAGSTAAYTHYTTGGNDFYFLQLYEAQQFPYINLSMSFCGDISGSTAMRWEGFVDVFPSATGPCGGTPVRRGNAGRNRSPRRLGSA